MRIEIVTPAAAGSRTGNRHTAARWAGFLRELRHEVAISTSWSGRPVDLMIALHARRSHESAARFRDAHTTGRLVVVLTGTDLYRDLPSDRDARHSLQIADRLVVLQDMGRLQLPPLMRSKIRVIFQSADVCIAYTPPARKFRVAVVGHLREEKDPFRTAMALSHLADLTALEVIQIGAALTPEMATQSQHLMSIEPRYRWIGSVSHWQAMRWMARSHVLVVSSRMEGGANVIAEAACIGVPVIASHVPGNIGMLGRGYEGYFGLGDEQDLARQLRRVDTDSKALQRLGRMLAKRRHLFQTSSERDALGRLVAEFWRRPR